MKVFVTGVAGQLGHDVMNELARRGIEGVGSDLAEAYAGIADGSSVETMPYRGLDITDPEAVERILSDVAPDVVVHCAAFTAVDKAEEVPELAEAINVNGTAHIARYCGRAKIPMMYFSTDYVFNGTGTEPWPIDAPYEPLGVYGRTKAKGELAVIGEVEKFFILRIAWVFGRNGNNFIKTMLRLAETHDRLTVVNDQIGNPTYTFDLARLVVDMIGTGHYGIYHVTNEGEAISWYDFARAIFEEAGIDSVEVAPVTSEEYGAKAKRPKNSRMDRSDLIENGFEPLPHWRDALKRYLAELG